MKGHPLVLFIFLTYIFPSSLQLRTMEAAISNGTFIAFLVQMHLAIQLPAAEIHLMFQDKLMIKISC